MSAGVCEAEGSFGCQSSAVFSAGVLFYSYSFLCFLPLISASPPPYHYQFFLCSICHMGGVLEVLLRFLYLPLQILLCHGVGSRLLDTFVLFRSVPCLCSGFILLLLSLRWARYTKAFLLFFRFYCFFTLGHGINRVFVAYTITYLAGGRTRSSGHHLPAIARSLYLVACEMCATSRAVPRYVLRTCAQPPPVDTYMYVDTVGTDEAEQSTSKQHPSQA